MVDCNVRIVIVVIRRKILIVRKCVKLLVIKISQMNKIKHCPFCKSKNQRLVYPSKRNIKLSVEDFAVTKESIKKIPVFGCNNCGLFYSDPLKVNTFHYKNVVDKHYEHSKETRKIESSIAINKIRPYLFKTGKKKLKVLDIGCLTGFFLDSIKKIGDIDCYGIEPSKWAVEICNNKGLKVVQGYFENYDYPNNYFDVITLFDCIEHVKKPFQLLEKVNKILKKDGIIVISTPNIESVFHKIFKKNFWFIEAMHLFYFSPKTIKMALEKHNFSVLENTKHYKCLTLGYALQRIKVLTNLISTSIENWKILQNIHVTFYAGQMLVVAKKMTEIK
jgi:2-polyprenyl-3-methyl-5-hydroxy-6-metoxy-1,4-benzoquinol methylase